MPTIQATVKFKTYVTDSQLHGHSLYTILKSRVVDAREISVVEYKVEEPDKK